MHNQSAINRRGADLEGRGVFPSSFHDQWHYLVVCVCVHFSWLPRPLPLVLPLSPKQSFFFNVCYDVLYWLDFVFVNVFWFRVYVLYFIVMFFYLFLTLLVSNNCAHTVYMKKLTTYTLHTVRKYKRSTCSCHPIRFLLGKTTRGWGDLIANGYILRTPVFLGMDIHTHIKKTKNSVSVYSQFSIHRLWWKRKKN